MTTPAAFRATYSDLKLIKTRQCVQIVFELPLADFDAAYQVLGGMPNPAKETWFGIAPLIEAAPEKPRRDWKELQPQQQAGIRCDDATFRAFLCETRGFTIQNPNDAAIVVRNLCGVNSRSELASNHKARVFWHQLDNEYQAWQAKERVGA